jgi:hypothetical protein
MHGATVPAGAACVSHETPSAAMPVAATHDHQIHAAATGDAMTASALPVGDTMTASALPVGDTMTASFLPVELPPMLVEGAAQPMGSHLAMVCVAILVGLLLLAAAFLRPIRTHVPPTRVQLVCRPVLHWLPPPDLAQLSILRN